MKSKLYISILVSLCSFSGFAKNGSIIVKEQTLSQVPLGGQDDIVTKTELVESAVPLSAGDRQLEMLGGCVAKHSSGNITFTADGLIEKASIGVFIECAKWVLERKRNVCGCWVACSPAMIPTDTASIVSEAIKYTAGELQDAMLGCK